MRGYLVSRMMHSMILQVSCLLFILSLMFRYRSAALTLGVSDSRFTENMFKQNTIFIFCLHLLPTTGIICLLSLVSIVFMFGLAMTSLTTCSFNIFHVTLVTNLSNPINCKNVFSSRFGSKPKGAILILKVISLIDLVITYFHLSLGVNFITIPLNMVSQKLIFL